MASERPEKQTVRRIWIEAASAADTEDLGYEPLFLTLSGAEGRDIEALLAAGLVDTAENSAIAENHKFKVVAIESSPLAVLQLQRKFPGLKILEKSFQSVIHGENPYAWPGPEEERFCRARVVNLDLNEPLKAVVNGGSVEFPVISWISKLAQLHADPPRQDWALCLTLHGEILWSDEACWHVQRFLADNFTREGEFAAACGEFLGADVCEGIAADGIVRFRECRREIQQAILMVFVPKYILRMVQHLGWKLVTEYNLRYGDARAAPMVTWVCQFTWSTEAISAPDAAYREGLVNILRSAGMIDANGEIRYLV